MNFADPRLLWLALAAPMAALAALWLHRRRAAAEAAWASRASVSAAERYFCAPPIWIRSPA